jgi:hypothetical protein
MAHLAIVVVPSVFFRVTTTSSGSELILSTHLPGIEEALLKLAAAMKGIETKKLTNGCDEITDSDSD